MQPGNGNGRKPPLPVEDLRSAGLRYVNDSQPGIRRRRAGRGFTYIGPDGKTVRDRGVVKRIRSLVISPAWTDVWICAIEKGHIQATGRDSKGRRQYRYHPRWREVRDENKFGRALSFADALPGIRDAINRDLARPGLPRRKVLATVARLLDTTLVRVGNAEYVRRNKSYGLTTLRTRHVELNGTSVRFKFRGKGGKEHDVTVQDRRVARVIRHCLDLPGYELFQYVDADGARCSTDAADVNDYLREISGCDFTAKDFRTWAGTVFATRYLIECGVAATESAAKTNTVAAVADVASRLGNTPGVARKCYIHPLVLTAYATGTLFESMGGQRNAEGGELDEELVRAVLRDACKETQAA